MGGFYCYNMNHYLDFENLINYFSVKIRYNVIDVFASDCFIVILVKVKTKSKKVFDVTKLNISELMYRLKKFTAINFCILLDYRSYISAIGNLLMSGCERKPEINYIRKRRKR